MAKKLKENIGLLLGLVILVLLTIVPEAKTVACSGLPWGL